MRDSLGRVIEYARISVTDRCNLRCRYCMPEGGVAKKRHSDILTYDEIVRICGCFSRLGINRLKVTGGEPLVRKGVTHLVERLKSMPGINSVTMTTNGILLPEYASSLGLARLDGVNVSLDTLDPVRYRDLTRGGDVDAVLRGIDAAVLAGIPSVKVNCVPMPGEDDAGLTRVAALARGRAVHVRFIEMMPLGSGAAFQAVGRERVRAALEREYGPLERCPGEFGNGPAEYWSLPGFVGKIGFINTLDHGVCSRCNRLRLTSEGVIKACLHMDAGTDLRPGLALADDAKLMEMLEDAVRRKPAHHRFGDTGAAGADARGMSQIGG